MIVNTEKLDPHPYLREIQFKAMKTTVEIPDPLFRDAKMAAARRGLSLKTFLTEALHEKLSGLKQNGPRGRSRTPPHMKGFGGMRRWHAESRRIDKFIGEEFSRIEPPGQGAGIEACGLVICRGIAG